MEPRRYQIFVSSTFMDLNEERAAVVSALLRSGAFPAGMELFPAADDSAWTLIKRVIDNSDYYLLVIGGRYGSVAPETDLSFTEMEYDYAITQNKPVMAFLHRDPDEIPLGRSEKDDATRAKLEAFRGKVQAEKHVNFWASAMELAGAVALTFSDFPQTYPATGWIRGDAEASTEALAELNGLRKQVAELEKQREASRREPPPGTEGLSGGKDLTHFVLLYTLRVELEGGFSEFGTHEHQTFSGELRDVELSWDEFFSLIGPDMLAEASEWTLKRSINDWLTRQYADRIVTAVTEEVTASDHVLRAVDSPSIKMTGEDFGTLIVQLRALGLIAKSSRIRSVKDTATYWSVTPYGDGHLTSLRARRRDVPAPVPLVDAARSSGEGSPPDDDVSARRPGQGDEG